MRTVRIALLTEIPAPFRIPLFNALAEVQEVDLTVLFLSDRDPKRPYPVYADEFRFRWRVLPGRELVRRGRWIVFSRGVLRSLRRLRPDVVVIGGWNQPAFWAAAVFARATRTPLVAWVESTLRDARRNSGPAEWLKRRLVHACTGLLVPGRASADYVSSLGVPGNQIVRAPNAVDTRLFRDRVDELRAVGTAPPARQPYVLYVGRLDPEKGVDVLTAAARDLPATVAIVGRGPEEGRLRASAPPNVRFVGWVPRDELPLWYAAADVFVLPSRSDQWGMVLNEAAAAGLPLVATDAPGAAHDLVDDGVNGFRVAVDDVDALRDCLNRLLSDRALQARFGIRSRELAARRTPQHWATAVSQAALRWSS
jgi:glycosyltransferase involved in cell wall biosynthesis